MSAAEGSPKGDAAAAAKGRTVSSPTNAGEEKRNASRRDSQSGSYHASLNDGGALDGEDGLMDEVELNKSDTTPAAVQSNVTIDPTKDLWQNISLNVRDSTTEPIETNLIIVGAPGSGKTTLLQRIYSSFQSNSSSSGAKKPKPTTALDYSFARRSERNISQVAHFWEIAQGTQLSQLCDVVATPENIHAMVAAVVVDCSAEGLPVAWEAATFWLRRLDQRFNEISERMKAKGSTTPEKMLTRAQKAVGVGHPDLNQMRLSGVPTVLVVNKLDTFRGETQHLKLLCRSMRYLAHLYGAHVIFTSEPESVKWRALMSYILFQAPFDPKYLQVDPERGAVLLTADKDSFTDIGQPDAASSYAGGASSSGSTATGDAKVDRWKAPFDEAFPPKKLEEEERSVSDPFLRRLYDTAEGGFGEPAIDALRRQKDEDLEQYRKNSTTKSRGR